MLWLLQRFESSEKEGQKEDRKEVRGKETNPRPQTRAAFSARVQFKNQPRLGTSAVAEAELPRFLGICIPSSRT